MPPFTVSVPHSGDRHHPSRQGSISLVEFVDRLRVHLFLLICAAKPEMRQREFGADGQSRAQLVNRFVVVVPVIIVEAYIGGDGDRQRIQFVRPIHLFPSLVESAHGHQVVAVPVVSGRVVWIEFNRFLEFVLGFRPVPGVVEVVVSKRRMRLSQAGIEFKRLRGSVAGAREGIERVEVAQVAERRIAVGQARVGGCVPCVHLNCFVELVDCFEQAGFAALVPKRAPAKVAFISRGIHHARRGQALLFIRRESDSNLFSNVARNFTLQIKYVANIALILFRPKVLIAGRVDQLRGDADLVAGAQYRAFDYSIDLQFLRNLRQRLGSRFVFRHRGIGSDPQCRNLGKIRDQLVCHSIREVLIGRIA